MPRAKKTKSLFGQIRDASVGKNGNFIKPDYLGDIRVDAFIWDETRNSGTMCCIEATCLNTSGPHKEGQSVTRMTTSNKDMFAANVKEMLVALLNCSEEEFDEEYIEGKTPDEAEEAIQELIESLTGEDQPLKGTVLSIETWNKKTDAGFDFTMLKYTDYVSGPFAAEGDEG